MYQIDRIRLIPPIANETEQIRVPFRLTLADGRLAISP